MIPYGRQSISEDDIAAVVEALRSDFITQGPAIERFERTVAEYCGAEHAVAVSSGTAALHVACLAADLGPGDTLWTSPNTFVASANCALYCGADVDFVDIDPATYNMSVEALEAKLEQAEAEDSLPSVVIPVHFAGQSCDMARIGELAERYGFTVIEDASHAIGGRYRGRPVGSCEFSSMTVFSFHPVKIVTTGEGGMVLTNDAELAERLRTLRTHGITRDPATMTRASDGPWYYELIELGNNYRMTDIQAALGASQMTRVDEFVTRRNELAERYRRAFEGLPVRWQQQTDGIRSAYHIFVIELEQHDRAEVFDSLRAAGIGVNVHYIPVHLQPLYRERGFQPATSPAPRLTTSGRSRCRCSRR
jgi:UDP-4-amino-4,6-dideoxy-N-acetyl-beta-L-altrosamine transaminase